MQFLALPSQTDRSRILIRSSRKCPLHGWCCTDLHILVWYWPLLVESGQPLLVESGQHECANALVAELIKR
jgi:hypothetical protein